MKNITLVCCFVLMSFVAFRLNAQHVELFGGVHFLGYKPEKSISEYNKITFGVGVNDVYKHFGFYCNYYSKSDKIYSDTIVVATLDEYRQTLWDTASYDFKIMPQGIVFGLNYLFPFRISVYAGAGMAQPRTEHHMYANVYMPSNTGLYDNIYSSEFSKSIRNESKLFMYEFGVDYDFIPSEKWACGLRVGYNSVMKGMVQVSVGYDFGLGAKRE